MADGSINFDTSIDTQGVNKASSLLKGRFKQLGRELQNVFGNKNNAAMDAIAQFIIDFFNWLDFFTDWVIETGLADHTATAVSSTIHYTVFTITPVIVEWATKLNELINT